MRSLAFISIWLLAAATAPAEQEAPYDLAGLGAAVKEDRLTTLLYLPSFEVDTRNADGLTTILSVHNHHDLATGVEVRYLDTRGNLQLEQEVELRARQTRTLDLRDVRGLAVNRAGIARGRVEIRQTNASIRLGNRLAGDYFHLDVAGRFATGDQLMRAEDHCDALMVRLLDFGSGARLRLFSNEPRGSAEPTAMFKVHNEAGVEVDSGPVFVDEQVEVMNARQLTSARFGTLSIDYLSGGGSLAVEYSAAGRFSVAMNATCTGNTARLDGCAGRRCPAAAAPAVKDDRLADLLHLPAYEVDKRNAAGLTTIFSVHNHDNSPVGARINYLDTAGELLIEQEIELASYETRTIDLRNIRRLSAGPDGIARGRLEVVMVQEGLGRPSVLTGDFFYLDFAGRFATGDQLLRREDHCDSLMARLLDFGSGVKLRLFSSRPQGDTDPTAMFTVYNEAGAEVDSGPVFAGGEVEVLNSRDLTPVRFGTLMIDYLEGGGSLVTEYSAAGRFSVAMNATCSGTRVIFDCSPGRPCRR